MPKKQTLQILHAKLWKTFSEYIRKSSADVNGFVRCISCGSIYHWKDVDCGHYISRIHWYTRYSEMNNNPQCKRCNAFLQGNAVGYRQGLIRKYGIDAVCSLEESKNYPASYTRDGLLMRIEEYKRKLKALK